MAQLSVLADAILALHLSLFLSDKANWIHKRIESPLSILLYFPQDYLPESA
jgi:hypothetical protein